VKELYELTHLQMAVGDMHKGEVWTNILGWEQKEVTIDDEGYGLFPCPGTSVSVYVNKEAEGRDRFGRFNDKIYE
jgi:alpha-amylase